MSWRSVRSEGEVGDKMMPSLQKLETRRSLELVERVLLNRQGVVDERVIGVGSMVGKLNMQTQEVPLEDLEGEEIYSKLKICMAMDDA